MIIKQIMHFYVLSSSILAFNRNVCLLTAYKRKMYTQYFLFFGFALAEFGIILCRGEIECPNAPVTPYPIPTPVTPCLPAVPTQNKCCSNQPIPLCCCYQCQTSTTTSNNCFYTTNQNSQCSSQYCQSCQSCSSTPSCSGSTSSCCGSNTSSDCCNQLSSTTKPSTTPTPPPETIIKCPAGTLLIENKCHLIYCPKGFHMINGRCVVIECPEGTVWMGHRCSVPEPIAHNVTFYNTVITHFNQTKPEIILNNTNNIVVNASLSLHDNTNYNNDCNDDDCVDTDLTTTTPSPNLICCIVMTPRMCENHGDRWKCFSRRSRRCGDFCVAPIIYLKIPRVQERSRYVVMPPIQYDCRTYGNCGPFRGEYDCSGCAINDMERCSHYCYHYTCPSRRCVFYDQKTYCAHNAGSYGCQEEDGCFDSWCL